MNKVIKKFSRNVPHWQPRVAPVDLQEASEDQLDALKVTPSNTKVSEYVLTLAHDVESLKVRTPLFNAIMYDRGGMSRAERELSALGASMVNHCVYCAAVHAMRHAQLEKSTEVTDRVFLEGTGADLAPRDRAILDFAVALSECPSQAGPEHLDALKAAGLDEAEVLDLILSAALFGWANRLMHVLGDPVRPEATG
ncbi:peroxidase-related enzyme [Salibaculum sp.]|uniref:peroxidase-related enzyme n=1 Tax=Salibaculum sp. TaxID=2855480 RepID=UPI002B489D76|nr:peroxidase-related enzyme [Salibaculum sp.]HKL68392.1 peroxidase-related enzyme [Salibaculum sp.]